MPRSTLAVRPAAAIICTSLVPGSLAQPPAYSHEQLTFGIADRRQFHATPDLSKVVYARQDDLWRVWLMDTAAGTHTQLTFTDGGGNGVVTPFISPDGQVVIFRDRLDHARENPEGHYQLFRLDIGSGEFTQLTHSVQGIEIPAVSDDGQWAAYVDLMKVYRVNTATGAIELISPTNTSVLSINGDGSRIATLHQGVLTVYDDGEPPRSFPGSGTNTLDMDESGHLAVSDSGVQLKVYDLDAETSWIAVGGNGGVLNPAMSPDGAFVLFESHKNINGWNPDSNHELFYHHIASGQTSQISKTTSGNGSVGLAGRRLAVIGPDGRFIARRDMPLNPDGSGPDVWQFVLASPPACPGDLTAEGVVNSLDLQQVLASFGQTGGGDTDHDGDTDSADLNNVLAAFGGGC